MLFNSALYLVFLPIVVCLFWFIHNRLPRWQTAFLLVASYIFYMVWNPIYIFLIVALTAVNFAFGIMIENASEQARKKTYLILGLAGNLLCLAYFKYAYFAIDTANWMGAKISYPVHAIILPLGISFFVFEFIHYLVDVYKGSVAIRKPLEFALFPSFFPTQIAGPIKRYQDFVPQLSKQLKLSVKDVDESIELILFGLAKKVLIADNLAIVVDRCITHPEGLTGMDALMLLWAFLFQVYFDFSGYTDIARGSAQLLGFKVPLNFDIPLMSGSITEYWRKWHISLSLWLRDYLFFPLGGSRGGFWRSCFNSLVTMTLAGLWHGAGIGYVAFGFIHGVYLVAHKIWRIVVEKEPTKLLLKITATPAFHALGIFLTFNCISLSLIAFRLQKPDLCSAYGKRLLTMFEPAAYAQAVSPLALTIPSIEGQANFATFPLFMLILIAGQVLAQINSDRKKAARGEPVAERGFARIAKPVYLAALAIALAIYSPDGTPSFVYFQF